MADLSRYSTEELLRMREGVQGQSMPDSAGLENIPTEQLLDMRERAKAQPQPTSLGQMRFEPEVQPAVSTAVSPEYAETPEPHFGILPKGTGEKFEKALPQWPVTEDMGTGQKALRTAGNLALGAAKFPVRMGTGVLEEPLKVPQALAEFIPTVVKRISDATGGLGLTGKYGMLRPEKEQVKQARRELMQEPFDVALLAAPALKGLKALRLKAPKPKPSAKPVVEAVKAEKAPIPKVAKVAKEPWGKGHKIGDVENVTGIDKAIVAKVVRIDGVDYELWSGSRLKEKRGAIRVFDSESGQTVTVKQFPSFDQAGAAYKEAVSGGKKTVEAPHPKLLQGEKGKVVGKRKVLGKPTELGFMGVTPESMKALGEPVTKAMRSISASTSQMIKGVKAKPEIVKGAKVVKETITEHDRFIRQAEATSKLLKRVTEKAVPKKDRQMLMVHAYEHKMKGKYWDQLNPVEKQLVRSFAGEKVKLNQFIKENKVLEMMPESEKISHIFHHWLDPKTKQPFKAMYGKLSKGLPQAKQRTIPTYEAGIAKGMKPATQNLGELIGLEWESAMRAHQTRQMIKSIYNVEAEKGATIKLTAKGKPQQIRMLERWDLLEKQGLTEGYKRYSHYALDKPMIFKDAAGNLVRMKGPVGVHKEIYPHLQAYMENPTYNTFDRAVSVSRSMKLGLNMFHPVSLAMQEAALSVGKLVSGHPVAAIRRFPLATIPRGLHYRKTLGPVERLLYEEGLELYRASEQVGEGAFFKGVGLSGKVGNVITFPVQMSRDFIFKVVQPGMKTAFAHDTFLSMLPKYLKKTDWTKEAVIEAYNAGKTIPKEARQAARQAVQMADGHFSGEHWRRSLLETNRFMAKMYFSPEAQTTWNRTLLSKTWQREHMLVAKNVGKSFLPDKLTADVMKLAKIHPAAKAEYRQYLYGAISIVGAVDVWNLMNTKMMDGKALHIWQNPKGKGFAVRASWNEPDYTVTDKNGKERTVKGGPAYIRPLKSLFEVAEWVHDPFKKFSYKLAPWLSAIAAQMPNNKYRHYGGVLDIPKRARDFIFDVFAPISIDQAMRVVKGQKRPQGAIYSFFGMPTSKLKMPKKEMAWKKKPSTSRTPQRPGARR